MTISAPLSPYFPGMGLMSGPRGCEYKQHAVLLSRSFSARRESGSRPDLLFEASAGPGSGLPASESVLLREALYVPRMVIQLTWKAYALLLQGR